MDVARKKLSKTQAWLNGHPEQGKALLIEMGHELYVKLHNHKIVQMLKKKVTTHMAWVRVGNNAEMVAWNALQLHHCPYPLGNYLD